jgi:hypothetical protein
MTTLVEVIPILNIKEPDTPIFMENQVNNMMHEYYNKSITEVEYYNKVIVFIG